MSPAAATSLYALLGKPVAGNPPQEMLEAAFATAGLDARYVSLEVEPAALADAMRGLRAVGARGAHVTVPHKVAVVPLLDRLSDAAHLAGAVNCVKRKARRSLATTRTGRAFSPRSGATSIRAGSGPS